MAAKKNLPPPVHPWMTAEPAVVHPKDSLSSMGISVITGQSECKNCKHRATSGFHLNTKFKELSVFISRNMADLEAPEWKDWMKGKLPSCPCCRKPESFCPVISRVNREINWLFLFLGRTLWCCSEKQLRYFCRKNHGYLGFKSTDDRLLQYVYVGVCMQLDFNSIF